MFSDQCVVCFDLMEFFEQYCYQVVGIVGLMMCDLMDVCDLCVCVYVVDFGIGMQLMNIVCDIVEDFDQDCIYMLFLFVD